MKIKSYKDLKIWNRSLDLARKIYDLTKLLPKEEMYCLTTQIRRAAISIPSNIAEGFARYHNKEYRQFLFIALGSCAELDTQINIALKLKYLKENDSFAIINETDEISKMIMGLIKKLESTIH